VLTLRDKALPNEDPAISWEDNKPTSTFLQHAVVTVTKFLRAKERGIGFPVREVVKQ
jgi:hypothetical protein